MAGAGFLSSSTGKNSKNSALISSVYLWTNELLHCCPGCWGSGLLQVFSVGFHHFLEENQAVVGLELSQHSFMQVGDCPLPIHLGARKVHVEWICNAKLVSSRIGHSRSLGLLPSSRHLRAFFEDLGTMVLLSSLDHSLSENWSSVKVFWALWSSPAVFVGRFASSPLALLDVRLNCADFGLHG